MRYYTTISGSIVSGLEKYVVKQNETKDVFLISFEDYDLDDIINIADDLIFIDAHKGYYRIEDKKFVRIDDRFKLSPKNWYKKFCVIYKKSSSGRAEGSD